MIKKALLLAFVAMTHHAFATNGFWLEKKDGSKIGYFFEQTLNISYTSSKVVIQTLDATVEHAFDDVRKVYFDECTTGITPEVINDLDQQIHLTGNGVEINGFAAGTPVVIADLSGRVVSRRTVNANGYLFVSKAELSTGLYVVKVDKTAIKFNNK